MGKRRPSSVWFMWSVWRINTVLLLVPLTVVTKVSKQLMLLEAERQRLQEDLEESRRELQKHVREVQVLQSRLKDAVTWDEHCSMDSKLRRYGCNVSFYRWKNKRRCFLTVLFIFSSFLLVTHIATCVNEECTQPSMLAWRPKARAVSSSQKV